MTSVEMYCDSDGAAPPATAIRLPKKQEEGSPPGSHPSPAPYHQHLGAAFATPPSHRQSSVHRTPARSTRRRSTNKALAGTGVGADAGAGSAVLPAVRPSHARPAEDPIVPRTVSAPSPSPAGASHALGGAGLSTGAVGAGVTAGSGAGAAPRRRKSMASTLQLRRRSTGPNPSALNSSCSFHLGDLSTSLLNDTDMSVCVEEATGGSGVGAARVGCSLGQQEEGPQGREPAVDSHTVTNTSNSLRSTTGAACTAAQAPCLPPPVPCPDQGCAPDWVGVQDGSDSEVTSPLWLRGTRRSGQGFSSWDQPQQTAHAAARGQDSTRRRRKSQPQLRVRPQPSPQRQQQPTQGAVQTGDVLAPGPAPPSAALARSNSLPVGTVPCVPFSKPARIHILSPLCLCTASGIRGNLCQRGLVGCLCCYVPGRVRHQ